MRRPYVRDKRGNKSKMETSVFFLDNLYGMSIKVQLPWKGGCYLFTLCGLVQMGKRTVKMWANRIRNFAIALLG
jgi:hypothetical protein